MATLTGPGEFDPIVLENCTGKPSQSWYFQHNPKGVHVGVKLPHQRLKMSVKLYGFDWPTLMLAILTGLYDAEELV